jgi:hypothetical protein
MRDAEDRQALLLKRDDRIHAIGRLSAHGDGRGDSSHDEQSQYQKQTHQDLR